MKDRNATIVDGEEIGNDKNVFAEIADLLVQHFSELKDYQHQIDKSLTAAHRAKKSAQQFKGKSLGVLNYKMIEDLQAVDVDIANALINEAEAQRVSYEFQRKLVEISRNIMIMGITNLANNRAIVRELELRLQNASQEKLDSVAKDELIMLVHQLKDQQDVMRKIERIEDTQVHLSNEYRKQMVEQKAVDLRIKTVEKDISDSKRLIEQLSHDLESSGQKYNEVIELLNKSNNTAESLGLLISNQQGIIDTINQELESLKQNDKNITNIMKKISLYLLIGIALGFGIQIILFILKLFGLHF